jgi:putative FmdB family regulatory protein
MPIYEYECAKCKRQFEYMQSMSEPSKKKCEKCGGKLERLISQSAFHLKGGGWYKDLYSKKPAGASSSEAKGETASKPEGKSDGGGEAKAPSAPESKAPPAPSDKKAAKTKRASKG